MARYSTAGVQDRIDSDRLDWDDSIDAIATQVRDLTVTPSPRLNVVKRRVQGVDVTTVVPRWDARNRCWTTLAPTTRRKAQEGAVGVAGAQGTSQGVAEAVARPRSPQRQLEPQARETLERWRVYRCHPLFGSLVGPAREAEGGWIEDDGTFWELVRRETVLIQRAILAERMGRHK